MAHRTEVILVDDLDGSRADETVTFGLDGVTYEIDLSAGNADSLRESLVTFVGHARRIGGRSGRRAGGRARSSAASTDLADVRAWARDSGYQVSDRGRLSGEILTAYEAAH